MGLIKFYLDISGDDLTLKQEQEVKGKPIPVQSRTGPEGSRSLRLPGFEAVDD